MIAPLLMAALVAVGCGNDERDAKDDEAGNEALYALSSMVFGADVTTTYVTLLDSLDSPQVDLDHAREFAGLADVWVHDGAVFVTELDSLTITKFEASAGDLVEQGKISFGNYGITDFGFWRNVFVSKTKAYLLNGIREYVIWDPAKMEIVGTLPLPEFANRDGLRAFPGYSDRAALIRDGRLYQPIYWTDESYFAFTPDSRIIVVDVEMDEVVESIEAPCPGLDFATRDEAQTLYFSSWVFAPAGAALLDQPATCVAAISAGSNAAERSFDVSALTDGREGGALRYLGSGMALLSVLHDERASSPDVAEVAYGPNWRFWSYDLSTGAASPMDAFEWNAGAAYSTEIDGHPYLLVPAGDYSTTTVYTLGDASDAGPAFETPGWSVRLFRVQ